MDILLYLADWVLLERLTVQEKLLALEGHGSTKGFRLDNEYCAVI